MPKVRISVLQTFGDLLILPGFSRGTERFMADATRRGDSGLCEAYNTRRVGGAIRHERLG